MTPSFSTIAHYRIVSKIGEGGMGAVYRATDTKLNRDVAIKVLPPAFAADTARMQRFEREAQVLASLNHPNIAAIYGIEQGAIVMELVEGGDLKGPVPADTAIGYAKQIAAGLEAAHEKGVIHRDLKPANIKVTPDGTVKLLDFGLSKATEQSSASSAASPTMLPTLSLEMTQAGVILGTAAYMSPEQARGKPVDKRADIWAFGVVLFELLAGKMLFGGGETVTDTIASVMTREPDWAALPADTPPRVRRLLEHCLRRDPKQRLRDIGDARLTLEETEPEAAGMPAKNLRLPWTIAAVCVLGALTAAFLGMRPKPAELAPRAVRFTIPLPSGTTWPTGQNAPQWAPSPDGRYLAFVAAGAHSGTTSLWVRPLDSDSAQRLDKTEGANFPFWSPDSRSIGFFANEKLMRVSVAGGSVQTVCPVNKGAAAAYAGDGGAWNPDGFIVFGSGAAEPLMRAPAAGGTPIPVTTLGKDEEDHIWPQFLPDGRHVLYFARNKRKEGSVFIQELGSAKPVEVMKSTTRAVWAPPGYLLFIREGTLFAQHLNAVTFQLEGEARPVAQNIAVNERNGRSAFAVSENGVLAYRSGDSYASDVQLAWRDREGTIVGVLGKPGAIAYPSLSPDEKSVAFGMGRITRLDIWVMDLASGVATQMTRDGDASFAPVWSPDSQHLAVSRSGGTIEDVMAASGKATAWNEQNLTVSDWAPDGRSILCTDGPQKRLTLLPLADGAGPQTILDTPDLKYGFRFSPDGKYVVYVSQESGVPEIYVAAFPSFAVKRKISAGFGLSPVWARSGKEIFYLGSNGPGRNMMSVEVKVGAKLDAGTPKLLFQFRPGGTYFSVTADGKRFLSTEMSQQEKAETEAPQISLVLHWTAGIQ